MKVASLYGHVPKKRLLTPDTKWPLPRCHIGLEWEFENGPWLRKAIMEDKSNTYFQLHEDGSLRDAPVEVTTAGDGLFGEDLSTAIDLLDKHIKALTYPPVCNYRTGFHVHLDIRDMEEKELHNLIILYCFLEKPIFNFVGLDRWKSNFCVPWFRSDTQFDVLKMIENVDTGSQGLRDAAAISIKSLSRYSALNCQSIAKFGTLEFRHMQNDLAEIKTRQVEFIKLIMHLKRLASLNFERGYHGPAFFDKLKDMTPYDLIRDLGFNLTTNEWDYPESLMRAVGLVNWKPKKGTLFFYDAIFDRFTGNHPNYK